MKKIMNAPERFVDDMLEGLLLAHANEIRSVLPDNRALVRTDAPRPGKVAIVTGGGSGHLPVFLGYVGRGLADGVAVGDVFRSPSSDQILAATQAAHGGAGVLYLYGNYMGDVMNFDLASEMAATEGVETRTVLVADDIASAPPADWQRRRGVAGLFFAYKVAGAVAEAGGSLEEVEQAALKAVARTRTMGVALSPCTVPDVGHPTFEIGEDEMEIGMGIHGEPGVERGPMQQADAITEALVNRLLGEPVFQRGDQLAVLVNGLGATPREELYILYRQTALLLKTRAMAVTRTYVGEFATSLEMAGASLTFLKLDPDLLNWVDAPARSPFFEQSGR